jgi:hypothetical protein
MTVSGLNSLYLDQMFEHYENVVLLYHIIGLCLPCPLIISFISKSRDTNLRNREIFFVLLKLIMEREFCHLF